MVAISLSSARLSIGIEVRFLEGSIDINFVEALRDNLLSPRTQVCENKALMFWNFCYRRRHDRICTFIGEEQERMEYKKCYATKHGNIFDLDLKKNIVVFFIVDQGA
ncbi:hypothetical protein Ancab_008441 [Ancistrocladus abbreviatus]